MIKNTSPFVIKSYYLNLMDGRYNIKMVNVQQAKFMKNYNNMYPKLLKNNPSIRFNDARYVQH